MKHVRLAGLLSAALLFGSSCSMLIRQEPEKEKTAPAPAGLSAEQIGKMSPEELKAYYEREKKRKEAKEFSENLSLKPESRAERKEKLRDPSRQLTPEEQGSVFPWHSEPGFRSESLRKKY